MEENNQEVQETPQPIKKESIIKKIPKHNWAIVTYALGILSIALLLTMFTGDGGLTGKVISESNMETQVADFVNNDLIPGGDIQVQSIEEQSGIYIATVEMEGTPVPLYFTRDGNFINPGRELMPITGNAISNPSTPQTEQPPQDIPKSDKPTVELFIMSHCPYGTQAEKGIIPAIEALGDRIDFNIRFVYYAMHGELEVKEQLNQYCIKEEQEDKYLDYLKCFLDSSGSESDGATCLTEVGIDKAKLTSCTTKADTEFNVLANLADTSSYLSGRYPLFDTDKALNEQYGIGGSPTLVINGQQANSGRDPASYLTTICSSFNNAPANCDIELSADSYSPGFGYTIATNDANAAAQCT